MWRALTDRRIELSAAALLGMAALATSWSGYQSTLWNGRQTRELARGTRLQACVSRAAGRAGQERLVDVTVFLSWVSARAANRRQLADFYERRFRAEFATAFRAWMAHHPFENPRAPVVPFAMAEYRLAREAEAARCTREAATAARSAQDANDISDRYMLGTVVFAVVLFFAGSAQTARSRDVRLGLLVLATIACTVGLVLVSRLPGAS